LRHRRRNTNQAARRASNTSSQTQFFKQKKTRSKKPLWFFLIIIIIGTGYYYRETILKHIPEMEFSKNISLPEDIEEKPAEVNTIPAKKPEKTQQYYSAIERKIQLEILNGCGDSGVAKTLTRLLKKSKYDVVNQGNYIKNGKVNFNVAESKIIDQVNKQENSRALADEMGILYSNVEIYEHPSPIADITIVIGKDYTTLDIFK